MRVLILVGLVGCSVAPKEGTWTWGRTAFGENTCDFDAEFRPRGDFYLRAEEDGSITVDPNDGTTQVFGCSLDGSKLTCDERGAFRDIQNTARLETFSTLLGEFSGGDSFEGSADLRQTCRGEDCAAITENTGISYPCQTEIEVAATWSSEDLADAQFN